MRRQLHLGRVDIFFFFFGVFFFYLQQPLAQCLTHEIFVKMKSEQNSVYFFSTISDFESQPGQVKSPSVFILEIVPPVPLPSSGGGGEMKCDNAVICTKRVPAERPLCRCFESQRKVLIVPP